MIDQTAREIENSVGPHDNRTTPSGFGANPPFSNTFELAEPNVGFTSYSANCDGSDRRA
jgi:hypothetical protein